MVTSEVVFTLDGDSRITCVDIFIQTPRPATS
jgi:hypothetical protein